MLISGEEEVTNYYILKLEIIIFFLFAKQLCRFKYIYIFAYIINKSKKKNFNQRYMVIFLFILY